MNTSMLITIFELAGWLVAGIFGIMGVFDKKRQSLREEESSVASNLIQNLTKTTEMQEKEITSLRTKEVEQGKEIAHLSGQVKVLTDILQGRDPATQKMLNQIPEIVTMAKHNGDSIEKLTKTLDTFMEKLTVVIPKDPMKL